MIPQAETELSRTAPSSMSPSLVVTERTILITPGTLALEEGAEGQLQATEYWVSGDVNEEPKVTWRSSDTSVATVNRNGLVRGVAAGKVKITASRSGRTGTAEVVVSEVGSTLVVTERTILITPGDLALEQGAQEQLKATEYWVSGDVNEDPDVTWRSSDTSVVTVNGSGLASGVAAGTASVTATRQGRTGTAQVVVSAAGLVVTERTILITPGDVALEQGAQEQLKATEYWVSGDVNEDPDVTWSSADVSVATVSSSGLVTAVASGTVSVTATRQGRSGTTKVVVAEAETTLVVTERTILITPDEVTLEQGAQSQLRATEYWVSGDVNENPAVTWRSSDTGVATVNETGLVTGVSAGTASISASRAGRSGTSEVVVSGVDGGVTQPPPPVFSGRPPAFPGAEGWGATALTSCRALPLQHLEVTSTASTGAGSLDQALTSARSDHFTFITFRTGGRIVMPSGGTHLNAGCVYIAGQTAPGDGIVLDGQGSSIWIRGSGENVSDIVMRYLRFRGRSGTTRNHVIVAKGDQIVMDHLSFSWADNYLMALLRYGERSYSAPISNVSIQNSIFSEALAVHPTAVHIATNDLWRDRAVIEMTNVSMHRNLFAHNSHRNPNTGADNILLANNVLYNWNQGTLQMTMRGRADFVNNYGKPGPMTDARYQYMVNPRCESNGVVDAFSIYAAGNVGPQSSDPGGNNWSGATRQVACYYTSGSTVGQEVPGDWRRNTPQNWASATFPIQLRSAAQAYSDVLADVGANARLTCDGRWTAAQDAVDGRILSDVRNGTGASRPITSEGSVGGFPTYRSGTPCADSDGDGLPDAWEKRFFECDTCAAPASVGRDGYLLMEHYLNGTSPL